MPGGNTAPVVRLGDTVRRVPGPWTTNVAALMTGLRNAGVAGVPEHRGSDAQGREVVEFVEGDVPVYPMPPWVWADEVLPEVARAVRGARRNDRARPAPDRVAPTGGLPVEVVCHGDVAPYNCVFSGGHLVALIDWDHALPGPRLRDLGMAAYRFVSLTPPDHPDGAGRTVEEQWRRVGLLCEAYGGVEPRDVVRSALLHLEDLVDHAAERAAAGEAAAQATIDAGHSRCTSGMRCGVRSLLAGG